MRIDRLRIKNFKGFAERSFAFGRSVDAKPGNGSFHVLIGQNGQGKTSALEAAAVAAGSWFLGVRGEDSRHIRAEDVRIKVVEFRDTQRVEEQFPVVVDAQGTVQGNAIRWVREYSGGRTKWVGARRIKELAEQTVQQMQEGEPVPLPLLSYYGTGRLWQEPRDMARAAASSSEVESDDQLARAFASRLAGYRFSIDPRCSPRDLLRWLTFEQALTRDTGSESNQYRVVKEAIRRSVEGCRRVMLHGRLGLLLDIEGQGWLPFGALSDGQRNIVAMVGDLAFKAAQLNPQFGDDVLARTAGVVLIDELDLHLHPRWQRHVVEDLRGTFPEVQFIVTTHSPFIIQAARDGELISLDAQPVTQTDNLGIEEIARGLMRVERPDVGPRYRAMVDAARSYFTLLDEANEAPDAKLGAYVERLAETAAPYADNPAFQAFLELKREAKLGRRLRQQEGA